MTDSSSARPRRRTTRPIAIAQVLLVIAAGALWVASRLPWVVIRSFDGLGPPRQVTLTGATWSTALLPVAMLLLAAAVAALAVRGWPLRVLAALLAAASFAVGYLGVSLWVIPDVAARGAELAHVPLTALVGSGRYYWGAAVAVGAAVCTLMAAAVLLRSASNAESAHPGPTKYAGPAARQATARHGDDGPMSERMIWDALDHGVDPTDRPHGSDTEGR
ncbi:TIGR02234 family membrane protein [Mycobacterium ostraviense]|uniref:TIGR02234 family membrane protein n=1 Tax=Mycobacterium ostraviense TaxID=2738409 RepID=UPI000C08D9B0|nr:TIGR02234 family membrane protein [Mycobacterium ostraviense]